MGKNILKIGLLGVFVFLLVYGEVNVQMSFDALSIWFEKLVPSMFVVLVLVKLMFSLGVLDLIAKPFGFVFSRLLHISRNGFSYVIAMMFLGFPAGASFLNEQVQEHQITPSHARRLIYSCSFATPGFVIMTCGAVLFHSASLGICLFAMQIASGLILLLCTRSHPLHIEAHAMPNTSFLQTLTKAILDSGKTLYMIGGYLMLCMSICGVLVQFFPEQLQLFLRIVAEFSSGSVLISECALPASIQLICLSMLLSFGGFCVHMQIMGMSEACHISYPVYFTFRILQACITGMMAFLIL